MTKSWFHKTSLLMLACLTAVTTQLSFGQQLDKPKTASNPSHRTTNKIFFDKQKDDPSKIVAHLGFTNTIQARLLYMHEKDTICDVNLGSLNKVDEIAFHRHSQDPNLSNDSLIILTDSARYSQSYPMPTTSQLDQIDATQPILLFIGSADDKDDFAYTKAIARAVYKTNVIFLDDPNISQIDELADRINGDDRFCNRRIDVATALRHHGPLLRGEIEQTDTLAAKGNKAAATSGSVFKDDEFGIFKYGGQDIFPEIRHKFVLSDGELAQRVAKVTGQQKVRMLYLSCRNDLEARAGLDYPFSLLIAPATTGNSNTMPFFYIDKEVQAMQLFGLRPEQFKGSHLCGSEAIEILHNGHDPEAMDNFVCERTATEDILLMKNRGVQPGIRVLTFEQAHQRKLTP